MTIEAQVAALTEATTALLNAVNVAKATLDAAKDAAVAAQGNAQNYLGQTQYARDQALAGLGAADNSQVLSELLGTITYALDLAGQAAKEMPSLAALFPAIDSIGTHIVAMMDLLGVTARTVAGGDVLLGSGLVGAPSLAANGASAPHHSQGAMAPLQSGAPVALAYGLAGAMLQLALAQAAPVADHWLAAITRGIAQQNLMDGIRAATALGAVPFWSFITLTALYCATNSKRSNNALMLRVLPDEYLFNTCRQQRCKPY